MNLAFSHSRAPATGYLLAFPLKLILFHPTVHPVQRPAERARYSQSCLGSSLAPDHPAAPPGRSSGLINYAKYHRAHVTLGRPSLLPLHSFYVSCACTHTLAHSHARESTEVEFVWGIMEYYTEALGHPLAQPPAHPAQTHPASRTTMIPERLVARPREHTSVRCIARYRSVLYLWMGPCVCVCVRRSVCTRRGLWASMCARRTTMSRRMGRRDSNARGSKGRTRQVYVCI